MRQNSLQKKQGPKGAGRGSSVRAGRQGRSRQDQIRQEKDTELETTIPQQTRERLTQYIGGETQVYDIRQ